MIAAAPGLSVALDLRARLADLYCAYDNVLNDGELERWPELFTDPCIYKVIPRENYEQGFPVAVIYCESTGMLVDRVVAMRETALYAPRIVRRMTSAVCVRAIGDGRAAPDREFRAVPDHAGPAKRGVPVRPLRGSGGR